MLRPILTEAGEQRLMTSKRMKSANEVNQVLETKALLHALNIPAVLFRGSERQLLEVNPSFAKLDPDPALDPWSAARRFLADPAVGAAIDAYVSTGLPNTQFEWLDGVGGRGQIFEVSISALVLGGVEETIWLVTLVDRGMAIDDEPLNERQMLRDGLTGLPNRTAFVDAIDSVILRDEIDRRAVLMIDLTRFSQINETVGSAAGDELIISIARRLVSTLRSGDMLARIGGDEFGVLLDLPEGPGDALHAARRVHAALLIPFQLSELEIRIECAIGCALLRDAGHYGEDVLRNAEFTLKRAKQSGRVEVYQQGDGAVARRRFSIETELRHALENGDLRLAFQPLIDLQASRIAGFEALARWDQAEFEGLGTAEFISVAEESGLIVPLGRWALHEALRTLADWDRQAGQILPIYVGVNVSAVQLVRDDVPHLVRTALEAEGIHGSRLMLELTESAIIADPERSTRMLRQLKALQVKVAMDDFGTGYSSLASLQRLPIDLLKIDRSFVADMIGNRDSIAIIRAILSLAGSLGMNSTAEGVENAEMAETLAALGCTYGQGYHFSRPLMPEQAFMMLADQFALSET